MSKSPLTLVVTLSVLGAVLFSACSAEESPPSGVPFDPGAQNPPSDPGLGFEAPSEWISETPSSSMRLAQYRLPRAPGDSEDGQMVVYYFGGGGGSVQANIDRWIGQFSMPDGSSAKEAARTSERDVQQLHLTIVDLSGTYHQPRGPMMAETDAKPNFRMLAVVAEGPGGPWFFKLTGPRGTIDHWEESFNLFLQTLQAK